MRYLTILLASLAATTWVARADEPLAGRPLEFEVTIVHVRSAEPIPIDQRAVTGATALDAVAAWRKTGKVEQLTTMRMSALENQKAMVMIGETAGVVVGRTFAAGRAGGAGFSQAQVQMEQYGTTVQCVGRIEDGVILVDVTAEQTRSGRAAAPPRTAAAAGDGAGPAGNEAELPPGRTMTQTRTAIKSKSGECQILGAAWSDANDGTTGKLVLLVPRMLELDPRK